MAVAFLTRLPTPQLHIPDMTAAVAAAMRWYPVIGLLLGLAAALPGLLLSPLLGGFVYVTLLVWLTRGLHWDGLADICDACGACGSVSPSNPEALHQRFGEVLKDSRLGAFGAMSLVLGIGGEILLATQVSLPVLVLAPLVGRSIPSLLHKLVPTRANSTLARLLGQGLGWPWIVAHLAVSFVLAVWIMGPASAIVLAAAIVLMIWRLRALAQRTGGMNGDFLGAGIVGGELLVLFISAI